MLARDSVGESVAVGAGTCVLATATVAGAASTDHTGPILAFAAAIFVALVTAVTTNRRQERALAAEAERQQRTLDGESVRLAQQLLHDRELVDVAAVRSALDEAAFALHRVTSVPLRSEHSRERVQALVDSELSSAGTRLIVRFGPGHALVDTFRACESELWDWLLNASVLAGPPHEPVPAHEGSAEEGRALYRQSLNTNANTIEEIVARFFRVAAETAGARLPGGGAEIGGR